MKWHDIAERPKVGKVTEFGGYKFDIMQSSIKTRPDLELV